MNLSIINVIIMIVDVNNMYYVIVYHANAILHTQAVLHFDSEHKYLFFYLNLAHSGSVFTKRNNKQSVHN